MSRNSRVYPRDGSTDSLTKGLNKTVDYIVEDIDDEIYAIASGAEALAQSIAAEAGPVPIGRPAASLAKTRPTKASNDVEEDVKLSHEIVMDQAVVANKLDQSFQALTKQLEEYKKLYQTTNQRLKEAETKRNELESKLEESSEEKAKLMEEMQGMRHQGGLRFPLSLPNGARPHEDLQKRSEELRRALLYEADDDDVAVSLDDLWKAKDFRRQLYDWINNHLPFRKDIVKIQSRFGSSVASYFMFYRFLFAQLLLASILVGFFLILHFFHYANQVGSWNELFSSPGNLPKVMLFSSFSTGEGLNYDLCVLFTLAFTLITLMTKLVTEDRMAKTMEALESEDLNPYSKEVLCAWDFSLKSKVDVDDYLGSIGNKLLQQLEETHSSGVKEARSRYQTFMVYARRSLGMVIYLAVLFASFCIILYVTLYSDYIAQNVKSIPGLRNMQSFIAPLILAMISSAMPEISKALTSLESWDSAQTIHTLNLLRVYISSLLNTLLLVFSYLVLADPFLLANDSSLRNSFGLSESLDFSCRMDQVSDGLFTLVVFTWVIQNTMLFAMPYAMRLFYYLFRRPSKKQEFHVSDNMVKRLDWMGLVFAAVPFCPMGFVFMPILLAIGFKWERYVIRKHYAKPTRMFSGQKAGLIYTFFYLCTFLTIGMTMAGYFFTSKTFAKECAIQDQYVDLCDPASTLASDNTCTMDPSSEYYGFYRSEQYPKVICERACGAFVNEVSHLSPFHFRVNSLFIMSYIWIACFDYPYIPWVGLLLLLLWVARVRNSLMVFRLSWFNKERSMDARLQANEAERKKQEKMIRKLKTIEEGEDGGGKEE